MRPITATGLAILLCGLAAAPVHASPITFTIEGTGTGSLGGQAFVDATFQIVAQIDTDDVFAISSGFQVVNLGTSVEIFGVGSGDFTNEIRTTANQTNNRVGFGDVNVNRAILFVNNAIFGSYDLQSPLGPIQGTPTLNAFSLFPTTSGNFFLSDVDQVTFTSATSTTIAPVPEPAPLLLLGTGLAAGVRRYRRRRITC